MAAFWAFLSAFCFWLSGFIFLSLGFSGAPLCIIPGVALSVAAGIMLAVGIEELRYR